MFVNHKLCKVVSNRFNSSSPPYKVTEETRGKPGSITDEEAHFGEVPPVRGQSCDPNLTSSSILQSSHCIHPVASTGSFGAYR